MVKPNSWSFIGSSWQPANGASVADRATYSSSVTGRGSHLSRPPVVSERWLIGESGAGAVPMEFSRMGVDHIAGRDAESLPVLGSSPCRSLTMT